MAEAAPAGDARPLASAGPAGRAEWVVEFSRFFNLPRWRSSSPPPPELRPLPDCKVRSSRGTWLSAASLALLCILKPGHPAASVLSVSIRGVVHEEHFVSSLNYSWPQVSCVSQCPIRGSRVVFVSFKDSSSQIEKFAVRFPTCDDAEAFLNSVKECSRETRDVGPPRSDFICENSSASEFIASNGLHYRCDGESSYEEPVNCEPERPALTYDDEQPDGPLQPLLSNNIESIFSGFPPSFTELLNNSSNDSEKEQSNRTEEADLATQNVDYFLNSSLQANASDQPQVVADSELKTQITKYLSDATFHEMLFKIEKVIDELGGDLSL